MTARTLAALRTAILQDLAVSQSTASSIAGRLRLDEPTVETACQSLLQDQHVETLLIAGKLIVYRATSAGLQSIA